MKRLQHSCSRRSPLNYLLSVTVLVGVVCYSSQGSAANAPREASISGVWQAMSYTRQLLPTEGGKIPFTDAGRALYEQNQRDLKDGKLIDTTKQLCAPAGTPRAMLSVYPFRIVAAQGQVTILMEENRAIRVIKLNGKFSDPAIWDPSYMGDSIGRWSGPTLIVDTQNFNTKTFLDGTGLPHGEQLHVTERLTKINGGHQLEDVITIADPAMFTRPWTTRVLFGLRSDPDIQTDWVCGQSHRDVSAIVAAAAR